MIRRESKDAAPRPGRKEAGPPVAALLTDFGLSDPYVGQMKAVLTSLAPMARIIDISHGVPAHDIARGGFFLAASLPWLPESAVIVAVVDPGVGSLRRIVLLEKDSRAILAPDNGLLTQTLDLPGEASARDVTPAPGALDAQAAKTFHGRDVFAPLAARLLLGEAPSGLGPALAPGKLVRLGGAPARRVGDVLETRVQHVDRFGNAILTLDAASWRTVLAAAGGMRLEWPARRELALVNAYADIAPGGLGLLEGSQGYFELAMNQDGAARELGLEPGAPVRIRIAREDEA